MDIFVSTKKKEGKSFEFVRFVEVTHERRLEDQLMNVWFDTYKVRANVSIFGRGGRYVLTERESKINRRIHIAVNERVMDKVDNRFVSGRTGMSSC